jgi:hypothetical protein
MITARVAEDASENIVKETLWIWVTVNVDKWPIVNGRNLFQRGRHAAPDRPDDQCDIATILLPPGVFVNRLDRFAARPRRIGYDEFLSSHPIIPRRRTLSP